MLTVERKHLAHDPVFAWQMPAQQSRIHRRIYWSQPDHVMPSRWTVTRWTASIGISLEDCYFVGFHWECHIMLHSLAVFVPPIETAARAWGYWGWCKASRSLAHRFVWWCLRNKIWKDMKDLVWSIFQKTKGERRTRYCGDIELKPWGWRLPSHCIYSARGRASTDSQPLGMMKHLGPWFNGFLVSHTWRTLTCRWNMLLMNGYLGHKTVAHVIIHWFKLIWYIYIAMSYKESYSYAVLCVW